MSDESGFDGLARELSAQPGLHFVSISSLNNSKSFLSKLKKLEIRLKSLITNQKSPHTVPFSPFWIPKNKIFEDKLNYRLINAYNNSIVLLMALEDQFGPEVNKLPENIKRRIFVVAHQPPAWHRLNWRDNLALSGLGGIICLSNVQAEYFSEICDARVIKIHHGVNLDFFYPKEILDNLGNPKLLFVGQWLRDFDTLEKGMNIIWRKRPDVELDCVVNFSARSESALYRLAKDKRVRWHSDIKVSALRELYQNADLLFLPLVDATANNAIIEALSSGLPVISSSVGGVSDYVPPQAGQLCAVHDAKEHADAALDWINNPDLRQSAKKFSRDFATANFCWRKIASELLTKLG